MLANSEDLAQIPNHVATDLGLHCLPMTLYGVPSKNELKVYGQQ